MKMGFFVEFLWDVNLKNFEKWKFSYLDFRLLRQIRQAQALLNKANFRSFFLQCTSFLIGNTVAFQGYLDSNRIFIKLNKFFANKLIFHKKVKNLSFILRALRHL